MILREVLWEYKHNKMRKQYRCSWKIVTEDTHENGFNSETFLQITRALTVPKQQFEQFSVCFILLFQVLEAFQSQIITISNSNVNHHLYSTEWGWNETSVNEIRKWPKAPELITQASEK